MGYHSNRVGSTNVLTRFLLNGRVRKIISAVLMILMIEIRYFLTSLCDECISLMDCVDSDSAQKGELYILRFQDFCARPAL
jgi:hypothetical protein